MEKKDDFYLPENVMEWIGLKKSEYLSELIQNLDSNDFSFEDFHEYDSFIPQTLEAPDSVYELTDEDYPIRTFVKSHLAIKGAFSQVIIGAIVAEESGEAEIFVPILSFVTKSEKLLKVFSVGHQKNRPTLN